MSGGEDKAPIAAHQQGGTQNTAHTINVSSPHEMVGVLPSMQQLIEQMAKQQSFLAYEMAAQRMLISAQSGERKDAHSAADSLPAPTSAIKRREPFDTPAPRTLTSEVGGAEYQYQASEEADVGSATARARRADKVCSSSSIPSWRSFVNVVLRMQRTA